MARILIPDLQPGATYAVQLRANNGDSVSAWSNIQYIEVETGAIGPDNVTGLVWDVAGPDFHARWDAVLFNTDSTELKDLSHYEVTVSANGFSRIYRTTDTHFTLPFSENETIFGGIPRATVTISLRAVNRMGVKSPTPTTATGTNPPPAAPTNFTGEAFTNQIALTWDGSTSADVVAYRVFHGSTSDFAIADLNEVWAGAAYDATHHSVAYNTDHYYKLVAVDMFGSMSPVVTAGPYRPMGVAGSVDTTPPSSPTGVTATAVENTDPTGSRVDLNVAWTGPTPASDTSLSHFIVRYSDNGTNWNYIEAPRDVLATRISNLRAGLSYYVSVRAVDFTANQSAWVNATPYPLATQADTTPPDTPAAPTAAAGTQFIQVGHNKMKADGVTSLGPDLDHFLVYADTTAGFNPETAPIKGTMLARATALVTLPIPAEAVTGTTDTWYVRVKAVDRSGNVSVNASTETIASVNLIMSANIGQAQIQVAHIDELVVNDILADEGIVNNLNINSTLTLGDALGGTPGVIKSYDYAAGSAGFTLGSNGLEINTGSIAANALRIQSGSNLLPTHYSSFEFQSGYYTQNNKLYTGTAVVTLDTTTPKFEQQSVTVSWDATSTENVLFLGTDEFDYNVPVEPGDYIVSFYVRNNVASSQTITPRLRLEDGAHTQLSASNVVVPASQGWTRYWTAFTVPSGTRRILSNFLFAGATGNLSFDGVQVERKTGATNDPSPWRPGRVTTIEGDMITTGIINGTLLDVNSVTSDAIDAGQITAKHLAAQIVLSSEFLAGALDADGNIMTPYLSMGPAGLQLIASRAPDGTPDTTVQITPTASIFEGDVTANNLVILDSASFRNETEIARAAVFTMQQGTTRPAQSPTVDPHYAGWAMQDYDPATFVQFGTRGDGETNLRPTRAYGVAYNPTTSQWHVLDKWAGGTGGYTVWTYDANFNAIRAHHYALSTAYTFRGLCVVNGALYTVLEHDNTAANGEWRYRISKIILPTNGSMTIDNPGWMMSQTTRYVGMVPGTDFDNPGRIYFVHKDGANSRFRVRYVMDTDRMTMIAPDVQWTETVDSDVVSEYPMALAVGSFDIGSRMYMITANVRSTVQVYGATTLSGGARYTGYEFANDAYPNNVGGLTWTGTPGAALTYSERFHLIPQAADRWVKYAPDLGYDKRRIWVTSSWYDSDGNYFTDASFEASSLSDWSAYGGATLAVSSEVSAFDGLNVLKTTQPATGMTADSGAIRTLQVAGGKQYSVSFYARSAATPRRIWYWLRWKDQQNRVVLSQQVDTGLDTTTTGWTRATATSTAPTDATHVEVYAYVRNTAGTAQSASEVHYFDAFMFHQGAVRAWDSTYKSHETDMGRIRYTTIYNRQTLSVTGNTYPTYEDANSPNAIKFFAALTDTATTLTPSTASFKYQTMTSENVRSATWERIHTGTASPQTTNTFPESTPSKIQSSALAYDSLPLLRLQADGAARVYSLHILLDADATTASGNAPGLRVGQLDSHHLRIGDQQIVAMSGTATQGTLSVNPGGSTIINDNAPHSRRYRASNQATFAGSTWTTFLSGTVIDEQGIDYSSGTYTIQRAGRYAISTTVTWDNVGVGRRQVEILWNGTTTLDRAGKVNQTATDSNSMRVFAIARLAVGDTIITRLWHNETSNTTVIGSSTNEGYSHTEVTWLGD